MMKVLRRIRAVFGKSKLDAEMAEEMRLHLELQTERNIASGMTPDEAHYAAQREFGNVGVLQQRAREQRGWRWLDEAFADFKFASRMLRKHPGFTAAAVLTLGLGIGFVATLFTMINGVAFRQLPFPESDRIVSISIPAVQFDDYARRQQSCESIAFVDPTSVNLRAGEFLNRYAAAVVSDNFLEVLKARPLVGRGFSPDDGRSSGPRTALIGYNIWVRDFGQSTDVLEREIKIDGETHAIIGVMPAEFGFPFNQEIWIPRRAPEPVKGGLIFGRLHTNISTRLASDQFTALARRLSPDGKGVASFNWNSDAISDGAAVDQAHVIEVIPFAQRTVKPALRTMLSAILAATFLVLLLACANVANLVLARAVDRRKELAVRAALGASRARLIRQMLTESTLVGFMGAVGGLVIATWGTHVLWEYMMTERPLTGGAPFWMNFDVDGRVFTFVAAVAVLASVLTGLVPALQASRVDLNDALKDGGGSGMRVSRLTRFLMNAQMSFSVCLVTVAGLFVTVLIAFNQKSLPYDPTEIFTARVSLSERRYDESEQRIRFFDRLLERLNAAPGVSAASLTSAESLRRASTPRIEIEGATYANAGDRPSCWTETVSMNFLQGFGVGLLTGRTFSSTDTGTGPAVAVVNAAFAKRFGLEGEIIGKRVRFASDGPEPMPWMTIIGVAPDLGSMKAGESSRGAVMYRPLAQANERAMTVLVRGTGDARQSAALVRREVAALDPDLPVERLQTVQEIIELERVGMNAFAVLFVVCGVGALVLASVGIYGVISFAVKLRTREFGVRMALGATRSAITRMVFGQGLRQISVGLGIGIMLALGTSALLRATLLGFEQSGFYLWVYAGVALVLAAVAGAALLIPARRAAAVDPMVALRAE